MYASHDVIRVLELINEKLLRHAANCTYWFISNP